MSYFYRLPVNLCLSVSIPPSNASNVMQTIFIWRLISSRFMMSTGVQWNKHRPTFVGGRVPQTMSQVQGWKMGKSEFKIPCRKMAKQFQCILKVLSKDGEIGHFQTSWQVWNFTKASASHQRQWQVERQPMTVGLWDRRYSKSEAQSLGDVDITGELFLPRLTEVFSNFFWGDFLGCV